jgi:hypothetical protein
MTHQARALVCHHETENWKQMELRFLSFAGGGIQIPASS